MKSPFFSPAYVSRSSNVADSVCVNIYGEVVETRNGKNVGSFYMSPGLDLLKTVGSGPINGTHVMNGNLYAVSGAQAFLISQNLAATNLGSLPATGPVSMTDNGNQVGIFFNGLGYYIGNSYSATGVTTAATPIGSPSPSGFVPGETVTLTGGTFSTATSILVSHTQVTGAAVVAAGSGGTNLCSVTSAAVVAGGSGGTDGVVTITGTTGTGTLFQATGNVIGGALIGNVVVTVPGSYSVNPTVLTAEPVTGGGLTGAQVSVTLSPLAQTVTGTTGTGTKFTASVNIAIGGGSILNINSITSGGNYTVNPSPLAAESVTGAGLSGATLSLTMGPLNGTISQAGVYSTQPANPVVEGASTGSGINSYWTVTWLTTKNALGKITLPFTGASVVSYQDGFTLAMDTGTNEWWQSDLFDLTTWSALNFASAAVFPTDIISIHELLTEQWLFKSDCTEVWVNVGSPGFSFTPVTGVFIETGIVAPFSVAKVGQSLMWLSANSEGQGQVVINQGYQPIPVSTVSIDREIQSYSRIDDAIAYSYQQEGHVFYVITFPSGDATWCYDLTESRKMGVPMWHKRASFSDGQFGRHWANNHVMFNGRHVVGDYANGNLYTFDLEAQTDNGTPRKWVRIWRALQEPSFQPVTFSQLLVDMQTGIGVAQGENPQVMLRWSDDGGHRWSNELFGSVGKIGQTKIRVKFTRLGSTKRDEGLDRIFELSATDPWAVALIGAELS